MTHYNHGQQACGRCKHKTRLPLYPVKAGKAVLMEVCGKCYQEIAKGAPLYGVKKTEPATVGDAAAELSGEVVGVEVSRND